MNRPICLNMIVKNEAANIERCLASVAPHIDSYVIADTGSTDGTPDIINAFFKGRTECRGMVVTGIEFVDFSQARNEALRLARAATDKGYILLCDADMELVAPPGYFQRVKLDADGFYMSQRSGSMEYDNLRLVHETTPCTYRGPTHEYLDVTGRTDRLAGACFIDHASGSSRAGKLERDIALLLPERDDPRCVFYLANSYYDLGDFDSAVTIFQRRLMMGGWSEEIYYSRHRMALCRGKAGDEPGMIGELLDTFAEHRHRAEPLHDVALHYLKRGAHPLALQLAALALGIRKPTSALFVDSSVYDWRLSDIRAVASFYLGDHYFARETNRRLLGIVPESEKARIAENLRLCGG